jgi:DNA-binding CsgD family transcriptional regulator
VLSSYREISAGHLPVGHPAGDGAVAAVPIWWRGDVIGVNVSFAGRSRRFTAQEIDGLEMLTQLAAPGIVEAGGSDPSLANMIREYRRHDAASDGLRTTVTEVGPARPVAPSVAGVALDLVTLAERAAARRRPSARLHVAVVHRADGLRLLVHDDAIDPPGGASGGRPGADEHGWQELADSAGGGVSVQHVAGWGTLVRADLPYQPRGTSDNSAGSPFTAREQQVAGLLASGSSDRMVAKALAISPKTVEKHVGALLRKTGTTSRTAAVVRALGRGWLAPDPAPGGFPPFPPEPPCT